MATARVAGKVWMFAATTTAVVIGIAGSYFLFIGGLFDLFSHSTLNSGIGWIDAHNRQFILRHGAGTTGVLKIIIGEPLWVAVAGLANVVLNLPGALLQAAGAKEDVEPVDYASYGS